MHLSFTAIKSPLSCLLGMCIANAATEGTGVSSVGMHSHSYTIDTKDQKAPQSPSCLCFVLAYYAIALCSWRS